MDRLKDDVNKPEQQLADAPMPPLVQERTPERLAVERADPPSPARRRKLEGRPEISYDDQGRMLLKRNKQMSIYSAAFMAFFGLLFIVAAIFQAVSATNYAAAMVRAREEMRQQYPENPFIDTLMSGGSSYEPLA